VWGELLENVVPECWKISPFHYHWALEGCRQVLAAAGEPEPLLPSCVPSKIEPFDFEADIEHLIEKKLREKVEGEK
jgi:hypothetical protein